MGAAVPRWVVAAVGLFWAGSVAAEVLWAYADPASHEVRAHLGAFVAKHLVNAAFWAAVTLAAVAWYDGRLVGRHNLARSVVHGLLGAAAVSGAFAVAMGATIGAASGGAVPFGAAVRLAATSNLGYAAFTFGEVALAANAYHAYVGFHRHQREASALARRLAEAELSRLRAQLEPHFLFNSLNAVAALVQLGRGPEAVAALGGLGALLRAVLEVEEPVLTWRWERELTARYVEVQRMRFGDRLDVTIDADLDDAAPFPALVLQPLVENAVRHGPLAEGEACAVSVRVRSAGDRVEVEVSNPLVRPPGPRGVGLGNLAARLHTLYGGAAGVNHGAEGGRYVVRLAFPGAAP